MTTLIANETLWRTLALRVRAARRVHAAVAYLGQGGAKRLALKRGDCLVVDMSPSTVRTGTTDPREIEKFIRRGVRVFTRRNLHAKLVLADGWVIVGSANISRQAEKVLDEAAILTNEPAAVRRGREFIERLCTEPVRPEYLKECKLLYRPPRFHAERTDRKPRQKRVQHAKLWLVKLRDYDLPDSEMKRYKKVN